MKILNSYFKVDLTAEDVVSSYSGVRPLFDDDSSKGASAVTRDYTFELDGREGQAPMLSAFGGKLTTYRKLSEAALDRLRPFFPDMRPPWTRDVPLPGGDMGEPDFEGWFSQFRKRFDWLPADLARHYARTYGSDADELLNRARKTADLGQHFGGLFYAVEAEWMMEKEWAESAEDMLTRRSKHHLFMSETEQRAVGDWLEKERAA